MAATTSGSLKAYIEGLGLGLSAYRDQAPESVARPYVVITEAVADVPEGLEDGALDSVRETVQISLFETYRATADNADKESLTLAPTLRKKLHGARLGAIGTSVVFLCTVTNRVRLLELDSNIVQNAITCEIAHEA